MLLGSVTSAMSFMCPPHLGHCRTSIPNVLLSIRFALVAHMRLPMHEGQNPRPLHENATSWLCSQEAQ